MKLKLAPGKVAVKRIEAERKGSLILPQSRVKGFDIAEITDVGPLDSFGFEGKEKTIEKFMPGMIIIFQMPVHIASLTTHNIKGVQHLFLNASDIVAKLDSCVIEMKQFHIAGRYVLLKPSIRKTNSIIIVPDTADEANRDSIHFSVLQKGADVNVAVSIGQEVFPNRGRLTTLWVDNEEVCFIDQVSIDGVLAED